MILTNYHTHCYYCDGKGRPKEYVEEAVRKGFSAIGFSSHAPLPFRTNWTMDREDLDPYRREIQDLVKEYQGIIEVYPGLEVDYIPGITGPSSEIFIPCELSYTIGSVHMMQDRKTGEYLSVDGPVEEFTALLYDTFDGNVRAFVTKYFELLREMASVDPPDIIGHFDLMKKHNTGSRYFTGEEPWYRKEALDTLDAAAESGSILEVNAGGLIRKRTDSFYPEFWILKEAKSRKVPVMLNADAHAPQQIGEFYREGRDFLLEAGYREVRVLIEGRYQDRPIE